MVMDFQCISIQVCDCFDDSVFISVFWAMGLGFQHAPILVCEFIDDSVCISVSWAVVLDFQHASILVWDSIDVSLQQRIRGYGFGFSARFGRSFWFH